MPPRPVATPVSWSTGVGTRIEPAAPEKVTGFVAGNRSPAKKMNWLAGALADYLSDWIAYLGALIGVNEELTYQTPKTRTIVLSLSDLVWASNNDGSTPQWCRTGVSTGALSLRNDGNAFIGLNRYLRTGETFATCTVLCKPGTAGGGNERMGARVMYDTPDFGTFTNNPVVATTLGGALVRSDGTVDKQPILLAASVSGHVVDRITRSYFLHIQAGDNGLAVSAIFYGARLTFTSPGPR